MNQAYIIDSLRTPIGSFGGSLSGIRADDLAAWVINKLMEKNPSIPRTQIDDVLLGCANQAGEDNRNVARMALLLAGLPYTIPGETINCLCASGMSAVVHGQRNISEGDAHLILAGGVENMTRGPWVMSKSSKPFGNDAQLYDSSFGWRFINPGMQELYGTDAMGVTAENLVEKYSISRTDQDRFAMLSQQKALIARESGRLSREIIPVEIKLKDKKILFEQDEFIKPNSTLEVLSKLKPAFKSNGTVTAGNSSGLNDGAAVLILASESAIKEYELKPLARIIGSAVVGVEPRIMGIGPVPATRALLQKTNLTLEDMDVIEINEAFAAQVLACLRLLDLKDDDPRVNIHGGAIALGHPLGMTGARLLGAAATDLQLSQKRYALVTMCVGVGQGYAVILERA